MGEGDGVRYPGDNDDLPPPGPESMLTPGPTPAAPKKVVELTWGRFFAMVGFIGVLFGLWGWNVKSSAKESAQEIANAVLAEKEEQINTLIAKGEAVLKEAEKVTTLVERTVAVEADMKRDREASRKVAAALGKALGVLREAVKPGAHANPEGIQNISEAMSWIGDAKGQFERK